MGWTVPSRVGRLGCVWDVLELPGTLEWDGQWDWSHLEWDILDISGMSLGFLRLWDGMDSEIEETSQDMSRMSLGFPGLWDGMDSGTRAIYSRTLGMCLGCPWASWDSGMGWTVGLEPSTVGHSGHVRDVPGLPRTPE